MVAATLHDESAPQAAEQFASARSWLLLLIFLVFAMVLVGGATRLTESGLSITEWNLVTGTVPPLSDAAWQAEFELYRQSPQYELLNQGMCSPTSRPSIGGNGRTASSGASSASSTSPAFCGSWRAARVSPSSAVALAAMGLLLGAQGIVGWIMVASGLEPGMSAVAPLKLMLHLTLACLFFAALVATFVRLGGAKGEPASTAASESAAWLLVVLAFVQIALGGLVAGHDAGLTYNTWPLMDGRRRAARSLHARAGLAATSSTTSPPSSSTTGSAPMCWPRRSSPMPSRCGVRPAALRSRALLHGAGRARADRARHRHARHSRADRLRAHAPRVCADPAADARVERQRLAPTRPSPPARDGAASAKPRRRR